RLIKLYTCKNDLVLDPFMGSGTTCQAAELLDRRWVGVDMDPGYCSLATQNMEAVRQQKLRPQAEKVARVAGA
ncbi:MAG TPA: site-specific DNA-methyltransferase, partial [Symbiobacteriaceae bacterium]|nr:site-specific DNA-methyltransferase [Symbiobacteriaceae bacterium]